MTRRVMQRLTAAEISFSPRRLLFFFSFPKKKILLEMKEKCLKMTLDFPKKKRNLNNSLLFLYSCV